MFLEVKNSEKENKIELYLDIINLDETKEKIWSYKSYEEICVIYIKNENHKLFLLYYNKLIEIAHFLEEKDIPIYVKFTAEKFVEEMTKKTKECINHWLEDICKDFNIFQKDKVINTFEAKFNLSFLCLANKIKKIEKEKEDEAIQISENDENKFDINVINYMQDKQKLKELTNRYLIEECGCDPKYLDSKGNTFFYYCPPNSMRGGEKYNAPIGWTGFGLEVLNRYGNTDWLGKDGKEGEWAVAYHGFGGNMSQRDLKNLIKTIIHDNLRPGNRQYRSQLPDIRHPGTICGDGVYITPNINLAHSYAGSIPLENKSYKIVIMVRVNRKYIREPQGIIDEWIVDGKADQLRPYRLLIKENNYSRLYY